MTFSRPGISGANIRPGSNPGRVPKISIPDGTTISRSAELRLDTAAPQRAYRNELLKGEQITNFLNFFTDPDKGVIKFANDEIIRSANREVADAVDQFGPGFLAAGENRTPEMRDAFVSLSGRAKEVAIEQQGLSAANRYGPLLQAELSNPEVRGVLTLPGNDPETVKRRSLVRSEAEQRALQKAGFPNSFQQLKYGEIIGKNNGTAESNIYKERMSRQAEGALMQTVRTISDVGDGQFDFAEEIDPQDPSGEGAIFRAVQTTINEFRESADWVDPQRAAKALSASVLDIIMRGASPDDKYSRLAAFKDYFELNPVSLSSDPNINLADVKIKDQGNVSLSQILESREPEQYKELQKRRLAQAQLEADKLMLNNGAAGYEAAREFAATTDLEPEYQVALFDYIDKKDRRTTSIQKENDLDMKAQIAETGLTPETADYIKDNPAFSQEFREEVQENRNNPDYVDPNMKLASETLQDPIVQPFLDTGFGDALKPNSGYSSFISVEDRALIQDARENNEGKPGIYEQRLEADYQNKIKIRLAEKIQEIKSDPDPAKREVDPKQLAIKIIDEVNLERAKQFNAGNVQTPKERFTKYHKGTYELMKSAIEESPNGKLVITEEMVVPAALEEFQKQSPDKSFMSLRENQKRDIVIRGIQRLEKIEKGNIQRYTKEEAEKIFDELVKTAEKNAKVGNTGQSGGGAKGFTFRTPNVFSSQEELKRRYKQEQQQMKLPVDDDAAPVPPLMRRTLETLEKVTPWIQDKFTIPAEPQKGDPPALKQLKEFVNSNGGGSSVEGIVSGFLNFITGAPPAYAAEGNLDNASAESLAALKASWENGGTQGLETAPLPQVAAATPTRYVPSAITTDKHEFFVLIGVAEGTRTAGGGYTKAYYGHSDPADGNLNRGTVSGGRGNNLSPQQIDRKWMRILTSRTQQAAPALRAAGLQPGTAGYNRMMFNVLDLSVQAPAAVRDFLSQLGQMRSQKFTVEAIARARADSFFNPTTGRLEAGGFNNSYQRLFKDQRSRAGVFDYRRRL